MIKHVIKHHKYYVLGGLGLFGLIKMFILFFFLLASYQLFQSEETFADWESNNNFIDANFWEKNYDNDENIIKALYGSYNDISTAYTQNWTGWNGQCNTGNMFVEHIYPGTRNSSFILSGYTIYVLNEGNYIFNSGVYMRACNAFIGNGKVNIYTENQIESVLYNSGYELIIIDDSQNRGHDFNIIDNVYIDGMSDGNDGYHNKNFAGILFKEGDGQANFTINNIKIYNNIYGLVGTLYYGLINNSQFFNNSYGALFKEGDYGILNNNQFYNNEYEGLNATGRINYISINNSQFYNNKFGISIGDSEGFILNNNHIYNNTDIGIHLNGKNYNYLFNNIYVYNNNTGIKINGIHSSGNGYYGTLKMFDNINNFDGGSLSPLSGSTRPNLNWTNGNLDTGGCMSCNWITNPNRSRYLQTGTYCNVKGYINGFGYGIISSPVFTYKYGTSISKQNTGVVYSGYDYYYSMIDINNNKYIAEINKEIEDYSGSICEISFINLISPNNLSEIEYTGYITFNWTGNSNTGYTIQIDDDDNFSSPFVDDEIYSNQNTQDMSGYNINTDYYWRVKNKETSEYSSGRSFQLKDTTNPIINLNYPLNASITTGSSMVFSWYSTDGYGISGASLYINGSFKGSTNGSAINVSGLVNSNDNERYVIVEDLAGNTEESQHWMFDVNIDNIKPTAIVEYDRELYTWATGNVIANLTGESELIIITNNSGNRNYTFNDNGTFIFTFRDDYGNTGEVIANVSYLDNTAPTTTQITTRQGSWSSMPTTGDQNLLLSGVDNGIGIENTWYCIGESMGLTCSPNITGTNVLFTCNTGELCQNKVLYYSKDLLGNIEDTKQSGILTIDKQGPQNIGFDINNGASIVTGTTINLTNITGYDLRGLFYPNTTQIAYGTSSNVNNRTGLSSTKSFILPNIDGEYTIYMRFRDGGGNISMTSGTIILDANSPVITINNPNVNPAQIKTISASTNEGTLTMTTGSTNTTCDASRNFITYESITFTGESDNGKYVCYRAIDSGGNTTYNLSNAIAGIDTTSPSITVISPSAIVGETSIFISVSTNENSECRYLPSALLDFDNMALLEGTGLSHSGNHIGSEGINTLYFRCKDVAGNISTGTLYEFTINLGAPVIQFVIGTTPNNPTNNSGVNIYLTGTDITKYKFKLITGSSCNGVIYDGSEINITNPITQGPSISDERYSYCAIGYKTGLNQWQAEGTRYDFVYDNTPPVITVNDGVNTNWNTGDNINLSVNYNLAGISETKYVWSTGLVCDGLNYSSGINYVAGSDIIIENGFYNNFYMCLKSNDLAGNISYTGVGPFKIDFSSPITNINNTGSNWIKINITSFITGSDMVVSESLLCLDPMIQISCALNPEDPSCPEECRNENIVSGGVGLYDIYYKILTGDVSCSTGNYIEYTSGVNIEISTGTTAIKTVCYYGVDNLGNTEGYKKQLYKIDKQGPSINLISPMSGGVTGSGTSINFVWSGNDEGVGISGYIFRLYNNSGSLITGINSLNTGISLQGLINGNYYWNVESIDFLGNTGISNTQYFENINQYVVLPNTNNIQDFINEFLNKGYIQSTGNDVWDGLITGTLIGNTDIYFGIDNQMKNDVILESSGTDNKISILIDSGSIIIKTGEDINSCNNILNSPKFVDNNIARDLMDNQNIFETFKVGSECENVSLKFVNLSGDENNIKIRLKSNNLDNDEYKVRYSNDGENRDYLGRYDYEDQMEIEIDHMTYFAISKDKQTSNSGGGSIKLIKDDCKYSSQKKNLPGANEKGIDYSDSYYDKDCRGDQHGITLDGDISGSQFSEELNYAYLYSYQIGITTIPHINQADMMGSLIRKHMAKMISNYALNEVGIKADESRVCNFTDIENESAEMGYYINLACQLGLMGLKSDGTPDSKFNPNAIVTRSQFGTALSRLLYGDEFNVGKNEVWYSKHLNNLKNKNIMNKIDNPGYHEKRGYVMLMLMRAKTLR